MHEMNSQQGYRKQYMLFATTQKKKLYKLSEWPDS